MLTKLKTWPEEFQCQTNGLNSVPCGTCLHLELVQLQGFAIDLRFAKDSISFVSQLSICRLIISRLHQTKQNNFGR